MNGITLTLLQGMNMAYTVVLMLYVRNNEEKTTFDEHFNVDAS
jgi:hypothetical protein